MIDAGINAGVPDKFLLTILDIKKSARRGRLESGDFPPGAIM